ncbi:MAG: hypothetical protein HXX10_28115 [Rhodoplanes sp.]|uniref:hypothetical protein n=1 Tax=Rhodoplanes sp. TaxID=1968906 RepID=UPI00179C563D|nr:hypothetical protein [Rhodoplanes sp.]NVO17904.1 hypothetical protein [Rhodoplanes sp.]
MKRSTQVGLVLMAAVGVGGGGYALMPGRDCTPGSDEAGLHAPVRPGETPQACAPRGSSGSSSGSSGRSWFFSGGSGDTSTSHTSSGGTTSSTTHAAATSGGSGVVHGGFGSSAHGFSSGG